VGIPFYGIRPDGKRMMAKRQCTEEYKLKAIRDQVKKLMDGKRPKGGCEMWVGISLDEFARAKPSRVQYIRNTFPLIDKGMRRWDCLQWLRRHEYPEPPKSACTFCPFRMNEEWRWLRDNDPEGWQQAIAVDEALRENGKAGRFDSELYIHRDWVPLKDADIRSDEDRGQLDWINECEGMCGV